MSKNETIWIIAFDGSALLWSDWEVKFLARGQRKGFSGILKGTKKALLVSTVIDEKQDCSRQDRKAEL